MTDTKSKIESRAGRLLVGFDKGMFYDYTKKTKIFWEEYGKNTNDLPSIEYVEDEIATGHVFPIFYVEFNEPAYITFTNPLSMFRNLSGRFAGKKGSEIFFFQYGLIPVYFATLNTMSMLKIYQDRAEKIFEPSNNFFEEMKCIEFCHKKGYQNPNPIKFSSMNIIEQSTAQERLADEAISKMFYEKYFRFGFWLQPQRGFTPSTHMEFGSKMNTIFKLSKSIYLIDELGGKEKLSISGKEIEVYNAKVRGVWIDTLNFGLPFEAKIESALLEKLKQEHGGKLPLVNGIMMEIRDRESMGDRKFKKILTVSAGHALSYFDMVQLASGMLCYRICLDQSIIATLLSSKGFQENVERVCNDWMKELKIPPSFSDKIENIFQTATNMIFPVIVIDKSSVYFTNPIVIGFMKKWDLIVGDADVQKQMLLLLLPLLDKIFSMQWNKRNQIVNDDNYRQLAKFVNNDSKFTSSLIRLVKEINLSNLIRKSYQTEFQSDENAIEGQLI